MNDDINAMNLKDVNAALAIAETNLVSLKPEYRGDLLDRIVALTERRRRLVATHKNIDRVNAALARSR